MQSLFARRPARTLGSIAALAAAGSLAAACSDGGGDYDGPYGVGGAFYASSGSAVDSDTNDEIAPFARNDSPAQAQAIGNPITLGGHVNQPGVSAPGGAAGRTAAIGDVQDWFRTSLARGQTVRLQIAENGTTNDLDLELRTLDGSLVASSATGGRTEEIAVTTAGGYYIVVVVRSGFSNYTLTIGQSPANAGTTGEPAFVPGQVVVRYRDRGRSGAADGPTRARRIGMRHVSGDPSGPMLFAAETVAERRDAFRALGLALTPEMHGAAVARPGRSRREDTRQIAAALRKRPEIRSADLNYVRTASAIPADQFYPFQWHYDQINLPQAWDVVAPNSGVVVAVIDSGVKESHPDLSGQLLSGFDFISDPGMANDGDGCDSDPDDPGDDSPGGSSFHGTHVTGTVAGRTSFSSGDATGIAGVAWNARVLPLRVLGVGGGTDFDIMQALRHAAGRVTACAGPGAATPARIANMSLGGPGFSQAFQDLITDLRTNEGMIFVAAAGNRSSFLPSYPAAFDGVISVSAVGPAKSLAPYSNFGSSIDVAAPGGDLGRDIDGDGFPDGVLSTAFKEPGDFTYLFYQGTSMASPHVAGVLALMLGINPILTPFDIDNALNAGAITEDIGSSQFFGNGLIDAARAVNFAAAGGGGSTVLDPVLRIDPDGLNFGFFAAELLLSASNGGNDDAPLTVISTGFTSDDGAPWLTLTPDVIDANGLGTYRATVDRSGLADGVYTGTIHFESDRNDVDVPVIMQAGSPTNAQANAGHHYILLVDWETFETNAVEQANAVGGSYGFGFPTTPQGDYLLVAGTDSDGDGFICDEGEACGAFPTTAGPEPVTVGTTNVLGLQFLTGFEVNVGSATPSAMSERRGYAREVGATPAR